MKTNIHVKINGISYCEEIDVKMTLLRFIREVIGLTGTKCGCENGECGACTVMLNGIAVRSCLVLAVETNQAEIITIEGLSKDCLSPLQQAFLEEGAAQCGFCTPGILVSVQSVINNNADVDKVKIEEALGGHLCRCTGYKSISRSIDKILMGGEAKAL
jgi:aerobic-type carbon monoxide dehydrogenase small subunit (CoxS/CutS family)